MRDLKGYVRICIILFKNKPNNNKKRQSIIVILFYHLAKYVPVAPYD